MRRINNIKERHSEKNMRDLIEQVQNLAKELEKTPASHEFELSGRAMYVFGSWNNFIIEAGLEVNVTRGKFDKFTKKEILNIVNSEIERIGSTKHKDYASLKSKDSPSPYFIYKVLEVDSWNKVLSMLDIKPNRKEVHIKSLGKKTKSKCKVKYCTIDAKSKGYCSKHYGQILRHGYIKEGWTEQDKQMHIDKMRNRKVRFDSETGIKGVNMLKLGKYKARIAVDYKEVHLGTFNTLEEAKKARIEGEKKHWGKVYTTY